MSRKLSRKHRRRKSRLVARPVEGETVTPSRKRRRKGKRKSRLNVKRRIHGRHIPLEVLQARRDRLIQIVADRERAGE